MSKSVLGRDPFASPAPAESAPESGAPTPRKRKPKAQKAARKKPAGKKASKKKAPKAPRKTAEKKARPKAETKLPGWSRPAEPDKKRHELERYDERIDRQELLGVADQGVNPLKRALLQSTFFLQPSYYGRKLGDMVLKSRSLEVDSFGFDPVYAKRLQEALDKLYDKYWRVEFSGAENLPASGRIMLVANHAGVLPYDGLMLKLAIERARPDRSLRFLLEDFIFHFPFLGPALNRLGGVRASQDNARRLLELGQALAVFPEGAKGLGKLYGQRYRLQRFGRGGFVKLALRTGATVLPVAIVGAEEIHPVLGRGRKLARSFDLPYLPLTPTFPWLGPLGLLPLPSKWMIRIGEPLDMGRAEPQMAEDAIRVMEWSEETRSRIQGMLDEMVKERGNSLREILGR